MNDNLSNLWRPHEKKLKRKSSKHQSLARRRFADLQRAKREKYNGPWKRPDRRREAFAVMRQRWRILRAYHQLVQEGLSKTEALEQTSQTFKVGASTIRSWEKQWRAKGKQGLLPRYQRSTPPPRTPFEVIQIIIMLRRLLHWGGKRIAAELAARGLYNISHTGVYNLFRRYRLYTRTYHPVGKRDGIQYLRYEAHEKNDLWHLDFAGPFEDEKKRKWYILVIIDDYSRFLVDLSLTDSLETALVTARLESLFPAYGKPKRIMTDNATTFVSLWEKGAHQFQTFLKNKQIAPVSIPPYYPQANGKAEAAVKITKREVMKPFLKQTPLWKHENLQQLLSDFRWYYNAHRLHGGLGWTTPLQRFEPRLKITAKGLQDLFFVGKVSLKFEFC